MPEDIRIRVIQENQGDALKKAADEKERLEKGNGGRSSLATPPPNINAPQPPTKQEAAAARREAAQRNKALIADAEEDLAKARAKGAGASVTKDLESQVREQKLKARFMREQGLPEEEALGKAQNLVALQNEARERKAGVKQQAVEEKQAALTRRADEKNHAQQALAAQRKADADRRQNEQQITREQKEQAAVAKARGTFLRRAGGAAIGVADQAAGLSGVGQLGSVLGSIGAAAGPEGQAAAVIVTAIAAAVAVSQEKKFNREMRVLVDQGNRAVATRQFQRSGSLEGSAQGSTQEIEGLKDEAVELEQKLKQTKKGLDVRWYNPATWNIGGNKERKIGEIEDEIALNKEKTGAAEEQRAKFVKETVAKQVDAEKKKAAGDLKGARAVEDQLTAYQEYRRIWNETHDDDLAKEGAGAKLANIQRERAANFSKFVTARDGVADTARVATAAHDERVRSAEATKAVLEKIHRESKAASDAVTRKNFSRP